MPLPLPSMPTLPLQPTLILHLPLLRPLALILTRLAPEVSAMVP